MHYKYPDMLHNGIDRVLPTINATVEQSAWYLAALSAVSFLLSSTAVPVRLLPLPYPFPGMSTMTDAWLLVQPRLITSTDTQVEWLCICLVVYYGCPTPARVCKGKGKGRGNDPPTHASHTDHNALVVE